MTDYEKIIQELQPQRIIELMAFLGVTDYEETEGFIRFPTVCHNDNCHDASHKLYYYKDNKFFYCYTNCGGMSVFTFLENFYKVRGLFYNWYQDIFLPIAECSSFDPRGIQKTEFLDLKERYTIKKKPITLQEYNPRILGVFDHHYPAEWLVEGITEKTMDKFNILFSPSQNKIIIPHYDITNRLIGIRGRALGQWEIEHVGKYMPVKIEQTWYSHPLSLNLYGLNLTKDNISETGIVYLFEGEKSVLLAENFNLPNCGVAVCGSMFNKHQLDILIKNVNPKEIIICFDKEEKERENKYFYKLMEIAEKYSNYCQFSFIYDAYGLLDYKDAPVDKGEEVFQQLLRKRIR